MAFAMLVNQTNYAIGHKQSDTRLQSIGRALHALCFCAGSAPVTFAKKPPCACPQVYIC